MNKIKKFWRKLKYWQKGALVGVIYSLILIVIGIVLLFQTYIKYGEILFVDFIGALGIVSFPSAYITEPLLLEPLTKICCDGNYGRLFGYNFVTLSYVAFVIILNSLMGFVIGIIVGKIKKK